MVRLKHRYLLINILYPEQTKSTRPAPAASSTQLPDTVAFHAPSSDALTPQLLLRIIRDGVAELFGDYGAGAIGGSLQVKYLSSATSTAIVRVTRSHYRLVWAALTYLTRLPRPIEQECVVQVVRVSGTIRKSEEEAIRRAKAGILRASREKGGSEVLDRMLGQGRGNEDQVVGIEDVDEDGDEDEDD